MENIDYKAEVLEMCPKAAHYYSDVVGKWFVFDFSIVLPISDGFNYKNYCWKSAYEQLKSQKEAQGESK